MSSTNLIPREIGRANQHDLLIRWSDGNETVHVARDLRLRCPCAGCVDEMSGRKTLDDSTVPADVHPVGIELVGRYAIQIQWSDGHSTGIYRFELLRETANETRAASNAPPTPRVSPANGDGATAGGISGNSTMEQVLEAYPSAQRALFRRYHIGGCSSCGFQPSDRLEDVCARKGITDVGEVIEFILHSDAADKRLQIVPEELNARIKKGDGTRLIDVRQPFEWEAARIPGAVLISEELVDEIQNWPKETPIVFYCHRGERSLDAAAFFAGHGFSNVKSLKGGIDAWSAEIDSSIPRYQAGPHGHGAYLRPA